MPRRPVFISSARIPHIAARAFIALAFVVCTAPLLAQGPSVTAVLTSSETVVGQPVQLQIKVSGTSGATPPADISVEGLDIRYSGRSQIVEGRNFQFNYSFTYNYTVMPLRAGSFKIPPLSMQIGSKQMKTPELTLDVVNGSGSTSRSRRGAQPQQQEPIDEKQIAFAELIVAKKSAYVGEMVPVEVRLGFNPRVRLAGPLNGPDITGQGFTAQKFPQPQETTATIDGKSYSVLTFKTALSAARTGKMDIGPAEARAVIRLPRRFSPTRSPFDIFNMDDPFADPFFRDPFGSVGEQRELALKSEPATLEVKPLPPNAPQGFSGAVGSFTMAADANPKSGKVGDPLTVVANITGRGSFDRVSAPILEDDRGWHTYPPSAKFKQDDDIGISGTKTFEAVLTPNERKSAVPPLIFAYFDPVKEKYVTLRSDPIPVRLDGGPLPTATPVPANVTAPAPSPTNGATATPAPKEQDILYQITDRPTWGRSFAPAYRQPAFWLAQLGALLLVGGYWVWKLRSARASDRRAQRIAALEHEAAELERKLRREDGGADTYYANAARAVQVKTAIARNIEPSAVDADAAANAFRLSDEQRSQLRELFRKSDESRYSGTRNGNGTVLPDTRRDVLGLVESLRV
jgi:hypothetical protein